MYNGQQKTKFSHRPEKTQRDSPEASRGEICLCAPLGPTKSICLAPPDRHQKRFRALLAPTLGPHGARKRPGGLQAFIFDPPGPPWGAFVFDVHAFSHGFLHVLLSRFVCLFVFVLVFAPLFCNLQVENIKVESPGCLNPWVAAGGREAIRIIVN